MNFLYRDASNYKCYRSFVLQGRITEEQKLSIADCLLEGEHFIPQQVGIPFERDWEISEDDHPFCELDPVSDFQYTDAKPDYPLITVDDLVSAFQLAKGKWNELVYSPYS